MYTCIYCVFFFLSWIKNWLHGQKTRAFLCHCYCAISHCSGVFSCPGSSISTLGGCGDCHFRIWEKMVTFEAWDPSDIWSEWCFGKKTNGQKYEKTRGKRNTNRQRPKRDINMVISGQFHTLAIFLHFPPKRAVPSAVFCEWWLAFTFLPLRSALRQNWQSTSGFCVPSCGGWVGYITITIK